MNIEGQNMETYQFCVDPMSNTKITEEIEFQAPKYSVAPINNKEKARDDSDDKQSLTYSVSPSDKIEKSNEGLVVPSSKTEKTTKESIKTQKVTNKSTFIIKLYTSAPKEILLEYKIPADISLLSGTGVSVTPERRIPRK